MESGTARPRKKKYGWSKLFVQNPQYFDYDLLMVLVFLMCFGLVMLYSTSAYSANVDFGNDMFYFSKQAIVGAVSFVIMIFISELDYHVYGAFSWYIYIFSLFTMLLVKTPLGVEAYGSRRWIQLPGNMTLQPSEIAKIAVILLVPYEICRLGMRIESKEGLKRLGIIGLIAAGGVFILTDNLSTAIIVAGITFGLTFIAHPKNKPFVAMIAAGAVFVSVGIAYVAANISNSEDFRLRRVITWLDPENHADAGGFQVMQGLYAIGSGGFFGKGLGNSTQKLGVIPEVQNDMILTIVCEELGVFGAIVILVLFGLLLYRLMFIARNAPDLYGSLVASGIFVHIALQVILNIAVVTNTIPTTGVTLPFISYGGTSILFLLSEMGIALGISRKIKLDKG